MQNGFSKESLQKYARDSRAQFEKILGEIVAIPTVSSESPRKGEVRRGADFAVGLLESFGANAPHCAGPSLD